MGRPAQSFAIYPLGFGLIPENSNPVTVPTGRGSSDGGLPQGVSIGLPGGAGELDLFGVHSFESATALDLAHIRALLEKLASVSERVLQCAYREQPGHSPVFIMYAPYRHSYDMGQWPRHSNLQYYSETLSRRRCDWPIEATGLRTPNRGSGFGFLLRPVTA